MCQVSCEKKYIEQFKYAFIGITGFCYRMHIVGFGPSLLRVDMRTITSQVPDIKVMIRGQAPSRLFRKKKLFRKKVVATDISQD